MDNEALTKWLFDNSGPILRHRIARDLLADSSAALRKRLLAEAIDSPEVQRWLDCLDRAQNIHGGKDTDAENALAKLLEYGLDRDTPAFDERARTLFKGRLKIWDPLVLAPLLIRAGYLDHPIVIEWSMRRLEVLFRTAGNGDFDFYLDPEEASAVPKAWRGKPIYRESYGHEAGYPMPTCFDLYALAYCPPLPGITDQTEKMHAIVAFLSDPRFQTTVGGYGWDQAKRRCYAAGRVFLACVEPARLTLFLEWGAGFPEASRTEWFQKGLAALESYRTPSGTYRFPPGLMAEKEGSYIYGGSHMGLGENRRLPRAFELESTFRRLIIEKRMAAGGSNRGLSSGIGIERVGGGS